MTTASANSALGYSAAASELAAQLDERGITVDADNPLFLYLPCGIGGAPGGVAFGAKAIFGDNVHAFFVEPVQSPCALVHMMSGSQELVSVYDVGLTNRTEADGMAVARMSAFVATVMREMLAGIFTVADDELLKLFRMAWTIQSQRLEPSAAAALLGPRFVVGHKEGAEVSGRAWPRRKNGKGHPRPLDDGRLVCSRGTVSSLSLAGGSVGVVA